MKGLAFFPGRYSLTDLGATAVVARNLFPEDNSKLSGAIIGMGTFSQGPDISPDFKQVNLLSAYRLKSSCYRLGGRLVKKSPVLGGLMDVAQSWVDDRLSITADKLAAKELERLLTSDSGIRIALGYSGESLLYGAAAKAHGGRYIVHSQFCHPFVQNQLIADAYRSIGLKSPYVSPLKLQRQLATLELADAIWCPSEFVQRSLVDNGISKGKTFVSYLGVDVNKINTPIDIGHAHGEFQILFVGTACLQKGVHVLLEALVSSDISNATLIFNGKADEVGSRLIRDYTARLEAKKILIRIDPGDPRRYLCSASLFVLPSAHDSYGIVVIEAMAAGLPVVVSTGAGAKECVQHGRNGFVFNSGDSEELSTNLNFLFYNPDVRIKFGRVSRELSLNHDISKSGAKIISTILESIC